MQGRFDSYSVNGPLWADVTHVNYYNHERYHELLDNLVPEAVFYGRGEAILKQRKLIKQNTFAMQRQMHYANHMKKRT
ncbi:MAG: hypothetical protein CMQ21_05875 [Gammaproteobacteria bacterium]|nr:hypothetical protein [Gammaproteobacteria bacterium]